MSEDWLKLHTEIIDDPKMTELTDFEFRIFISLLCVARQKHDDGRIIMTPQELSWRLRYSVTDIETSLDKLLKLNILTYVTGGVTVVNYCKRQYSESFLRVKRYRERKRNVTETLQCNGTRNAIVTRDKNRIDKIREETTIAPNQKKIAFDFGAGEFQNIPEIDIKKWEELYPAVNIKHEIKLAADWLINNPAKRKKNYRRFLSGWFSRTQEKGGRKNIMPENQITDTRRETMRRMREQTENVA